MTCNIFTEIFKSKGSDKNKESNDLDGDVNKSDSEKQHQT